MLDVYLKAVGNAPPLLPNGKKQYPKDILVGELVEELKRELAVDNLLLYVNAAFIPSMSDSLEEVFNNFSTTNQHKQLCLHYSLIPAWG